MYRTKINRVIQLLVLIALVTVTVQRAQANIFDNSNGPVLPEQCSSIRVDEGHKLTFHTYARGFQIYKWNALTQKWDFVSPIASLYAEQNFFGEVGIHYGGPIWESKSGSKVEARRVMDTGCAPDPNAIPWLLLSKHRTEGNGIFSTVTFIQRVNTTGGLAPTEPGSVDGERKEVAYTAEYYFYKAENLSSN